MIGILNAFFIIIVLFLITGAYYYYTFDIKDIFFPGGRCSSRMKLKIPIILAESSSYYNKLNEQNKIEFEKRVIKFIESKRFISRNFNLINDEMKIRIAGSVLRITFGMDEYYIFEVITKIFIFPDDYISTKTKKVHKGETSMIYVALSAKSFIEGDEIENDSWNLGLHEFSHALYLNEKAGYKHDSYQLNLDKWEDLVLTETKKSNDKKLLRSYAYCNSHEFFAVAMEYFFEKPEYLKNEAPDIYQTLCGMLLQNPLTENFGIYRN